MRKIDWRPIGNLAKDICKVVAYYGTPILASVIVNKQTECRNLTAGYDDVVSAIMHSDMLSSDKCDVVSVVRRNGDAELYRALIHIINDHSLLSSYKKDMIKQLCGK